MELNDVAQQAAEACMARQTARERFIERLQALWEYTPQGGKEIARLVSRQFRDRLRTKRLWDEDDAVQELYLHFAEAIADYTGRFAPWWYVCARNYLLQVTRSNEHRATSGDDIPEGAIPLLRLHEIEPLPEDQVTRLETFQIIREARSNYIASASSDPERLERATKDAWFTLVDDDGTQNRVVAGTYRVAEYVVTRGRQEVAAATLDYLTHRYPDRGWPARHEKPKQQPRGRSAARNSDSAAEGD